VNVRVVAAPWVLTGGPALEPVPFALRQAQGERAFGNALSDGAVALDGDTIVAVGPRAEVEARFGRGERLDAILLPALVNAHLHLEVSHLAGRVQGGEGLPPWVQLFVATRATAGDGDVLPAIVDA